MKCNWLIKKNKPKLILFFAGWGQDENPFKLLESQEYDVIMFFDYRGDNSFDLSILNENYKEIHVIAWSMGVWYANSALKNVKNKLTSATAINGTLAPIDDLLGIPPKIFQGTFLAFSESTKRKFFKRMCYKSVSADLYFDNLPHRGNDELKDELSCMLNQLQDKCEEQHIYNKVVVSVNDLIFPTENQERFWKDKLSPIKKINQSHFPFYAHPSWDELLNFFS